MTKHEIETVSKSLMPVILFNDPLSSNKRELYFAKRHFPCHSLRSSIPKNSLVIPRYVGSGLYFRELAADLDNLGSVPINSYAQHRYISEFSYYEDIKEFTPESWFDRNFHECKYPGPFI